MKLSPKRSATSSRRELKNSLDALAQTLGQVEMRPIAGLRNYARNARKHPERQLVALESSIRQFGFTIPAVIDPDGELIAGEARLEAARRLGLTEVPVLVAHQWSRDQKNAYRLTDNRLAEHATWDIEFLAAEIRDIMEIDEMPIDVLGWGTAEIDVICDEAMAQEADGSDPADAPVELPATPVTQPGDLWLLAKHRALCGSALIESDWERLMAGAIASMSISDPPFNVPITGHVCGLGKIKHDPFAMATGEMSKPEFVEFLTTFISLVARHCHDGSVIDVFMDWRSISELNQALTAAGLTILNLCVWNKGNGGMGSLYRSKHELVYIA